MTHSSDLLQKLLFQIQKARSRALVVFDLDSTLFDVSHRTQKILEEFVVDPIHKSLFPQSIEILKEVKINSQDWGLKNALIRAGLHTHPVDFHQAVRKYWIERFFSGDYLRHDRPMAGAVAFVKRVAATGARLVYLTGRDLGAMYEASRMVLASHGFPEGELVLKPVKGSDDALFKVQWFRDQPLKQFEEIYFFENEPENIHFVSELDARIKVIFVDSTHSGQREAGAHWPRIQSFLLEGETKC